jgi:integrator complex subunit 6
MPVSQMGNYQEYLKRMTSPLREVESMPVRQHMFGNPFKIDKVSIMCVIFCSIYFTIEYFFFQQRMMVDEADVDLVGAGSGSSSPRAGSKRALDSSPARRKPGPLPRHVCASPRPRSPSPAPFSPINSIVETPPILLPNGGETGMA